MLYVQFHPLLSTILTIRQHFTSPKSGGYQGKIVYFSVQKTKIRCGSKNIAIFNLEQVDVSKDSFLDAIAILCWLLYIGPYIGLSTAGRRPEMCFCPGCPSSPDWSMRSNSRPLGTCSQHSGFSPNLQPENENHSYKMTFNLFTSKYLLVINGKIMVKNYINQSFGLHG